MATQPSPALYRALLAAYAANSAAAELMRETRLGDPMQWRLDGTTSALQQWLEQHAPADESAPVAPSVAPAARTVAAPQPTAAAEQGAPAIEPQPLTKTEAVLAVTAQLGEGATARTIAAYVEKLHGIDVDANAVRAIQSKARQKAEAQPKAQPLEPEVPEVLRGIGGPYL